MSAEAQADYAKMTAALHKVSEQVAGLNDVHQKLLKHTANVATTVESFHRADQLGPYPFSFRPPTAEEAVSTGAETKTS
eukprot:m.28541 g.28541  ORF g.28541 m.28541 type:complete len:79 (-) comp4526_c0_seq1:2700-2936(-)